MISIYESIRSGSGELIPGLTKLFIKNTDEEGSINKYMNGVAYVPEGNGTMFIVDDWLVEQINKLQFLDGQLTVKDGEELTVPEKTAEEIEREQLLARLAELDAQQPAE